MRGVVVWPIESQVSIRPWPRPYVAVKHGWVVGVFHLIAFVTESKRHRRLTTLLKSAVSRVVMYFGQVGLTTVPGERGQELGGLCHHQGLVVGRGGRVRFRVS